jgi:peptide/nickel transport system ATP-binding protein
MTPLLALDGVSRVYRSHAGLFGKPTAVRAVDHVDLDIAPGATLGIVGESGCGKSTTGRLALGLEPPDSGQIRFRDTPLPPENTPAWRALRRDMQLVFQDPLAALDRRLTIAQQIAEPLEIHGIGNRSEREDRIAAVLADVGLRPDLAARHPHELSGGQRQRAVLARALATNPALLVADEPISALDVSIQAQIVNMLTDLQAARGIALMFISHDLKVVRQISHDVAVMYLGRVIERGPPETVFDSPSHPYTQALVSAIPTPGPRNTPRIVLQGEPPNPANRPTGCAFHPRCPVAIARCRSEIPPLLHLPDGRQAACHLTSSQALAA